MASLELDQVLLNPPPWSTEETTESADSFTGWQVKLRKYNEDLDFRVVDDNGGNYCNAWSWLEVHPLSFYTGWAGGGASSRWQAFYRHHTRCHFEQCPVHLFLVP